MTRTIALALATLAILPAVASAAPGDPDPSFDGDGKRMVPQPSIANDVLVQPDGKIIVVGNGGPANDFVITRLLADGSHDRSFDGDGTAIVDFGGQDQANAATLQPDGRIVVAGERLIEANADLAVVRLLPTGKPDTTFGPSGDGKAVIDEPTAPSDAAAVLVRPDGRIVIPGPGYSDTYDMAVVQLTSLGAPDGTTWDRGNFGAQAHPYGAALAPDGALVVAGTRHPDLSPSEIAVARFRPDGKLDATFGGTGKVTLATGEEEMVGSMLVQRDGKVVVAGTTGKSTTQMTVTRFDREGEPDRSWSDDGRASAEFDGYSMGAAAALQPDGKVVVAGVWIGEIDIAAARFTPSGALDASFSSDGRATVPGGFIEIAQAVALQPDGRVVLAGAAAGGAPVARLLADSPPPPPPPAAAGDTLPPALTGLRVTPKRIRFTLSEPARVRFTVQRLRRGRSRGVVRSFAVRAPAGVSRVPLRARRLRAGRYRLIATPVDRAGNTGRARRAPFQLVKPSKRRNA
jgi:uncharacterized delta-60 repeat protein